MSLAYCPDFVPEGFTDGDERWNEARPLQLEAKDMWYGKHFYKKPHMNYLSCGTAIGDIVISIAADISYYRLIIRNAKGAECHKVVKKDVSVGKWRKVMRKGPSAKDIIVFCRPELANASLITLNSPSVEDTLYQLEEPQVEQFFRVGLVYSKSDQEHENDMFHNCETSPEFDEFCEFIGEKIELKGWSKYDGGLDTKLGMSGKHSIFTDWNGKQIMWHVSTMLPYFKNDSQQLERKKFIGNDRAVIIFRDGDAPITPNIIASKQLHILGVIQPHTEKDKEGTFYRFAIASKNTVPPYEPDMPYPPVFMKNQEFKDFLFTKILNGVATTRFAKEFSALMHCLYVSKLNLIITQHKASK